MKPLYLESVDAAERLTLNAAHRAGQLEADHMDASARWMIASIDARHAGDELTAEWAASMARGHLAAAKAAAAVPNVHATSFAPAAVQAG